MTKIPIKTPLEIDKIREACKVTSTILSEIEDLVHPGINTELINEYVLRRCKEFEVVPAPLNYQGFPKAVCTSINEVVCHGIPDTYDILRKGDIINIDVTVIKDSYHGDASRMYFVGGKESCSKEAIELVDTTKKALKMGIKEVAPGKHFGDIGAAISEYIDSTGLGYGVVREYTGHGIGKDFHEPPQILHVGKRGTKERMKEGMVFTIEPMINQGVWKTTLSRLDGWTARTADGKLSAQWEHTVLVTKSGVEVLTA